MKYVKVMVLLVAVCLIFKRAGFKRGGGVEQW